MPPITGRHISGISVDDTARAHTSAEESSKSIRFGFLRTYNKALERLPSRVGSSIKESTDRTSNEFEVVEWKTQSGITEVTDLGRAPTSSSNKTTTAYRTPLPLGERRNVAAIAAPTVSDVDRLYRLDDELVDVSSSQFSPGRGSEPNVT